MRIEIRPIEAKDYTDEMAALARRNWSETGCDFEFDPDIARYDAMCKAGIMRALGAFDGSAMVGYSTMFMAPHTFNPRVLCAFTEALFVAPEYRRSSAAHKLIMATEDEAAEHGCQRIYWHTAAGTRLPDTLARRGYRQADIVMEKELVHG